MKIRTSLIAIAVLAGCATMGNQNRFAGPGVGPVSSAVDCLAEEFTEDGWTIASRDDAGLLRAEMGADWIDAEIVPQPTTAGGAAYELQLTASNSPMARDAASDLLSDCAAV